MDNHTLDAKLDFLISEIAEVKRQNAYLIDVINDLTVKMPNMGSEITDKMSQMRAMIAISTGAYQVDQATIDRINTDNQQAINNVANAESKFNSPFNK